MVKWLGRYLYGTCDKGLILKPLNAEGELLDLYADSNFTGNWDSEIAKSDLSTACSHTGYVLFYCRSPLLWASKMQMEIMLSSSKSEYIALSQAIHAMVPIMELLKEMKALGFAVSNATPRVHCCTFEDNSSALKMACIPKMHPCTKHLNQKYHFFHSFISSKDGQPSSITIHKISTDDQTADFLTKSLPLLTFCHHQSTVQGWDVGHKRECENNEVGIMMTDEGDIMGLSAPLQPHLTMPPT